MVVHRFNLGKRATDSMLDTLARRIGEANNDFDRKVLQRAFDDIVGNATMMGDMVKIAVEGETLSVMLEAVCDNQMPFAHCDAISRQNVSACYARIQDFVPRDDAEEGDVDDESSAADEDVACEIPDTTDAENECEADDDDERTPGEEFVYHTVKNATKKMRRASRNAGKAAKDKARDAADAAKDKAHDAADAAKEKAQDTARKAGKEAKRRGRQFLSSIAKRMNEFASEDEDD